METRYLKVLQVIFIFICLGFGNIQAQVIGDPIRDTINYPGHDSLLEDSTGIPDLDSLYTWYKSGACDPSVEGKCVITFMVQPCIDGWRAHLFYVTCYKTEVRGGRKPKQLVFCRQTEWRSVMKTRCSDDTGSYKQSGNIPIDEGGEPFAISGIYPNPINDVAVFNLNLPTTEKSLVSLLITDMSGRVVDELRQDNFPGGEVTVSTEFNHLSNGIYSVTLLVNGEFKAASKMIVAR